MDGVKYIKTMNHLRFYVLSKTKSAYMHPILFSCVPHNPQENMGVEIAPHKLALNRF